MTTIKVTEDEVRAAQLEVRALLAAGLTPDPLVLQLAQTTTSSTSPMGAEMIDAVGGAIAQSAAIRPRAGKKSSYRSATTGRFASNAKARRVLKKNPRGTVVVSSMDGKTITVRNVGDAQAQVIVEQLRGRLGLSVEEANDRTTAERK